MCLCCYGWPITMPRRAKFRCKIQDAATPFSKSKRRSIKPGEVLIFISNWTLHSATFSHAGLRHRMRNKSLSASTKIHTPLLTLSTKLQRQVYAPESSMYNHFFYGLVYQNISVAPYSPSNSFTSVMVQFAVDLIRIVFIG